MRSGRTSTPAPACWSRRRRAELVALAELLTLPCATTLNGKSAFPEDHPLSLGIGGFVRARYNTLQAAQIAESADVDPRRRLRLQIRGDADEAWRRREADPGRHRAVRDQSRPDGRHRADGRRQDHAGADGRPRTASLPALAAQADRRAHCGDRHAEAALGRGLRAVADVRRGSDQSVPRHQGTVRAGAPEDTIVLHDAGTVRGTVAHHYPATHPRSFIGFGVQSSMGWSLGAAVGAKKAHPDKLVVAVIGEEALHETAIDIETSVRNDAPVLILVKNNGHTADRKSGKSQRLHAGALPPAGRHPAAGDGARRQGLSHRAAGRSGARAQGRDRRRARRPHHRGRGDDEPFEPGPEPAVGELEHFPGGLALSSAHSRESGNPESCVVAPGSPLSRGRAVRERIELN